ncbi:hypothetical protein [Streptomyces sp. BE133]|uniref:hypothetical protein n=1 Tax=Streptomyces sp. BE133 TaxID=3002523 RepID=UPI002E7701D5|nr:hypothetical protein [Streptomyces sp. BE133]MEE1808191.1 hypothetical protein [Streptomyces sp. BE133]
MEPSSPGTSRPPARSSWCAPPPAGYPPFRHLGDGSYLARIGYGVLPVLLTVRVVEASVTVNLADGAVRTEQWRLLTSLLDPAAHPAAGLVDLYHERWQSETTYFSIKATMLDGRVLRSRSLTGLDQEVYALLTTYQALIRAAADTACTRPGLDMDRISFTVLQTTAADTVVTATGILPPAGPADLVGAIGRAALEALHPARHRHRVKARTRKNPHQQVRSERRTTPHDQSELHRPHHRRVLRTRTLKPLTNVNTTVLTWGTGKKAVSAPRGAVASDGGGRPPRPV